MYETEVLEEGEISSEDGELPAVETVQLGIPNDGITDATGMLTNSVSNYQSAGLAANPSFQYSFRAAPANSASLRVNSDKAIARDLHSDPEPSNSDEDDDVISKRRRMLEKNVEVMSKQKKNIWSNVLMEQQLTSDIKSFGHSDSATKIERGVETYQPSGERRVADPDPEFQPSRTDDLWNVTEDGESRSVKKRVGQLPGWMGSDGHKNYQALSQLPDDITEDDDERTIARFISRKLLEPKVELLVRVTRYAGKPKTVQLYRNTVKIEADGGMMTAAGDKKRTPGGVFFQLLKLDSDVTKEMLAEIFTLEKERQKETKREHQKAIRKRKYGGKSAIKSIENEASSEAAEDFDLMEEPNVIIE